MTDRNDSKEFTAPSKPEGHSTSTVVFGLRKLVPALLRFTFGERLTLSMLFVGFIPVCIVAFLLFDHCARSHVASEHAALDASATAHLVSLTSFFEQTQRMLASADSIVPGDGNPIPSPYSPDLLALEVSSDSTSVTSGFTQFYLDIPKSSDRLVLDQARGRWLYIASRKRPDGFTTTMLFDLTPTLLSIRSASRWPNTVRIAIDSVWVLGDEDAEPGTPVGYVPDFSMAVDGSYLLPRGAFAENETVFVQAGAAIGSEPPVRVRVFVGVPVGEVLDQVFEYRSAVATWLLLLFITVLLVSMGLARLITRPLLILGGEIDAINSANLKELPPVEYPFHDEVSDLQEAVRKLSADLRAVFSGLEESRAELERTVEQRTQLLQSALRELNATKRDLEVLVDKQAGALVAAERRATIATLVNGLAHNLKSPLANILGYLCLLREECAISSHDPQDEKAEWIALMIDSCEKIRQIIDTMLERASNRESEEKVWINVNRLLEREVMFMESDLFFKHQIAKELVLDPDQPSFLGSYAELSQVVENILRNAREAMQDSAEKKLKVVSSVSDGSIVIEITDSGEGMDTATASRIFDPYFSTKRGRSMIGGSGLGLSYSKTVIEGMGGSISVLSSPGKGSSFIIRIPVTFDRSI